VRTLLAALAIGSCGPQYPDPTTETARALDDSLAYWDGVITYRDDVDVVVDWDTIHWRQRPGDYSRMVLGECIGWVPRRVIVYAKALKSFAPANYYRCFRHVLTHELLHAHLTCTLADHVNHNGHILAPTVGRCDYYIDPDTIDRVEAMRP
jgi:hypothetical protein